MSRIYSDEELETLETLEGEIKPLEQWIRANKGKAPANELKAKNGQLIAKLKEYNAVLDGTYKTTN